MNRKRIDYRPYNKETAPAKGKSKILDWFSDRVINHILGDIGALFYSRKTLVKMKKNRMSFLAIMSICSGIQCLGYFNTSKTKNEDEFVEFIVDYFPPSYKMYVANPFKVKMFLADKDRKFIEKDKLKISEILYKGFRCAMVHSWSLNYGAIIDKYDKSPWKHLQILEDGRLIIHLEKFWKDFKMATQSFLEKIRQNHSFCQKIFFPKYKRVFINKTG